MAVELQTGEISEEISVDDLRLRIREIIRRWNWGVIIRDIFMEIKPISLRSTVYGLQSKIKFITMVTKLTKFQITSYWSTYHLSDPS